MGKSKQKRFAIIKSKVQNAKNDNWQARPKRSKVINFNKSKKLLYDIEYSKITYEEALEKIENIRSDIIKIINIQSQHKPG